MPNSLELKRKKLLLAKRRAQARSNLLRFMQYVWWMPSPLIVGHHTREIAEAISRAVDRYKDGVSSYLDIEVAYRHGKSDLSSRALPAYAMGALKEWQPDIMLLSYAADLSHDFSRDTKAIIQSPAYQALFPGTLPARGRDTVGSWGIDKSNGKNTFTGLGGSYVGKGAGLLIVDDWFAGKDEARSEKTRKARWEGFTDALTRLAPVHIVIVVATSWHTDGVRARLKKAEAEKPGFPKFEHLSFPAKIPGPDGKWGGKYLFPERFSDQWYEAQYASQGHWASALLDCEPVTEGGNRFAVDRVIIDETDETWPKLRETRGWDLASSKKERDGDDPDYTWGVRGGVKTERLVVQGDMMPRHHIYIRDAVYCQEEAPERDRIIRKTAKADGAGVLQAVEGFGGYKDAYTSLKRALAGVTVVRKSQLPGDKSAKLAPLEPSFDGAIVHMLRADWNDRLLAEFASFPDGSHDDGPDATAVMYHESLGGTGAGIASPYLMGR